MATSRYNDFRDGIRAAVRGLWMGALTRADFIDSMTKSLENGLSWAWREGSEACGVPMDEWTADEGQQMDAYIGEQIGYLGGFADDIKANSKEKGGTLEQFLARAEIWANRYNELKDIARLVYCQDERLIWKLGKAEHCETCAALNGWVKRASYWQRFYDETGIRPKAPALICGGWNCKCNLQNTRQPITPGRPPVVV